MTKAQLNKVLIEERAKSRSKQRQSAFMRRSLSIYNGQKKRLKDLCNDPFIAPDKRPQSSTLPYSLDELRQKMQEALTLGKCDYCGGKLTLKKITPDHRISIAEKGSWDLDNLAMVCQQCNWQKSTLSEHEFCLLLKFLNRYLSSESRTNVRRRLVIGGKWSPR
jgi:5-methylcytosine-specific restriction endonuclease McrA